MKKIKVFNIDGSYKSEISKIKVTFDVTSGYCMTFLSEYPQIMLKIKEHLSNLNINAYNTSIRAKTTQLSKFLIAINKLKQVQLIRQELAEDVINNFSDYSSLHLKIELGNLIQSSSLQVNL